MSRWLSQQKAARLAEHTAKEAGRQRTEKLKLRLQIAGIVLLMVLTYAAWAIIQGRLRQGRHRHHDKKPSSQNGTNRVELLVPDGTRVLAKVEFETRHDGR